MCPCERVGQLISPYSEPLRRSFVQSEDGLPMLGNFTFVFTPPYFKPCYTTVEFLTFSFLFLLLFLCFSRTSSYRLSLSSRLILKKKKKSLLFSRYLYSKSNACLFWTPIWLLATWVRRLLSIIGLGQVGLVSIPHAHAFFFGMQKFQPKHVTKQK